MKRILAALDTTDNSSLVLSRAVELANALGAKIRLLSAVQMPPVILAPPLSPTYFDTAPIIALAEATLRERERDIPAALRDGIVVEIGVAAEVICAVARSYGADLVVIGAHRHGILARMLGTTAATIVNHIDRPVIVVRPIPAILAGTSSVNDPARAGSILHRDHENLEKIYGDLLAAYRSDDWEAVRTQWAAFEPAIRTHMETEEHDVFPELRAIDPVAADALLAEHVELRRILGALGVAIDLHAVPGGDAQELVARLRAHGAREEAILYGWMNEAIDAKKLHRLSPTA